MILSVIFRSIKTRAFIIRGLFVFLWQNKLWWLTPLILILVIFFLLMIFVQSSSLGPLIYPLI